MKDFNHRLCCLTNAIYVCTACGKYMCTECKTYHFGVHDVCLRTLKRGCCLLFDDYINNRNPDEEENY